MTLARSVHNPQKPDHILLKAGFSLDDETILRMRELRIRSVWVKYPNLNFLDEILDPEIKDQNQKIYSTLKTQFSDAQELSLAKMDYSQYVQHMSNLFQHLLNNKTAVSGYLEDLQGESEDILYHGTVVAYLSMLVGIRLEAYLLKERPQLPAHLATNLTSLGVGALLHDVGKLSISKELREFHPTAQDMGTPQWQQHTEAGYEMVKGGLDPCAAQVVLNHHQNFDGSGYPPRKQRPECPTEKIPLKGSEIHVFCRIASVANCYENLRYMPDGTYAPSIVALKRLHKSGYAKWFDPTVYQAFLETVPPFSLGEMVTLSNGQPVVITEINDKEPCRPTVRPVDPELAAQAEDKPVHASEDNAKTAENDINLMVQRDLFIAKAGDFDVKKYLY